MTIEVRQEHIYNGIAQHCYKCPIALAVKDAINESKLWPGHSGHCFQVRISGKEVTFLKPNKRERVGYTLPPHVKDFIERFDLFDHGVKIYPLCDFLVPFSFQLPIVE